MLPAIKAFELDDFISGLKPEPSKHEYDHVVVLIDNQKHTITIQEAQYMLMVHEQRIEYLNSTSQIDVSNSFQQPPMRQFPSPTNQQNQANVMQSTAYYATPESVSDESWYADSGATNHVTSDLSNLSLQYEYKGNERLVVAQHLLYCISKFTADNNAIPEFVENCFVLKDKTAKRMLLTGTLKNGLYELAFSCVKASMLDASVLANVNCNIPNFA
ncbi:hypothetical protein ACOSQ2_014184 [Xanthoceras sorbifolium]